MIIVARTAQAVGERDDRCAKEFSEFTEHLQAIADLEDLTEIRQLLVESSAELKTCVNNMARDGQESVAQLQEELSAYQHRLEEAERLASLDDLTGLSNRRTVEHQLELLTERGTPFCVILFDLNGFKQINDLLLRQFSKELQLLFRMTDVVGWWGGDEFIVVLDCGLTEAESRIGRIQEWAFGEYTLLQSDELRKVNVSAAVGVASWNPGETVAEVLRRADIAMYKQKAMPTLDERQYPVPLPTKETPSARQSPPL